MKKEPRTRDLFTFFQNQSYNHSTNCQRIISPTVSRFKTILSLICRHCWGEKRAEKSALPSGLSSQFLFCLSTVFPTWKQVSLIPLLPIYKKRGLDDGSQVLPCLWTFLRIQGLNKVAKRLEHLPPLHQRTSLLKLAYVVALEAAAGFPGSPRPRCGATSSPWATSSAPPEAKATA